MFYGCRSLTTVPQFNLSSCTEMSKMFDTCYNLISIPQFNTSNVENFSGMLYYCQNLTSLPALDFSSAINANFVGYSTLSNLTDMGGLLNLKCAITYEGFEKLPNLTYQSCINVLNGLYDFTGNGETPTSSQGKLKVHANFLTTVGDEISIGVNKGWTITA